jgi:periplasmic divalent cation tolerance protein
MVLVTAPDLRTARRLARVALESRRAACVNLVPGVESHYWWQKKIERGREILLLMKTARAQVAALERVVMEAHPYDTPEFVVLEIRRGNARYLQWLGAVLKTPKSPVTSHQ